MEYVRSQTMCICVWKTCVITTLELISSTVAVELLTIFHVNMFNFIQRFLFNRCLCTGLNTGLSSPYIAANSCPRNFLTLRYARVISHCH